MDIGVLMIWLLPAMVYARVMREDAFDPEGVCRVYSQNGLLHFDCSDRGLSELPDQLNYKAQALILANNNFVSFPKQIEKFTELEILDLSGNRLSQAPPSYLEDISSLKVLNLSNNNYDSWLYNDAKFNFKKLDLSKNKINKIEDDAFANVMKLSFLDLSENRLYDIQPGIFSQASSLNTLILSRNYFSKVPKFESQSLRNLHLSNCQIMTLEQDSLAALNSLLVIDLSMNQLERIPDSLASATLQELDFSYNEIFELTDLTFSSLPHLAVLDLRGNEFKYVWSTSYFSSNPFLREVRLKGNRWCCEGFSVNLLLTYEFLTKEPSKIQDRQALICYTPSNVTQLSWQQAYIKTWHADITAVSSYTTMAVMIGIIIGIVLTSFVCRGIMYLNKINPPPPSEQALNGLVNRSQSEPVTRIPLREDEPPTYDEALLMPRLNSSFHSLPDFVDEEETLRRNRRRSRSIGDLIEPRPRLGDRRSIRRTLDLRN
ncbi:leucine-rich repeat-containing G-protein coupled receptor 5-like [Leptidea sinapis]|uniref:leucine-rich repeat-containing G-protein coupled receptor 5-like n=1 Tax=Leptidea sinapis TaxID=189913 RepID=UPI0021C29D0D|nr:leucine-rich repeat-containing G-protein coupled receptor 5-like [Leptidea sinapis]